MSKRNNTVLYCFAVLLLGCPKNNQNSVGNSAPVANSQSEERRKFDEERKKFNEVADEIFEDNSQEDFQKTRQRIESSDLSEHEKKNLNNMFDRQRESNVCFQIEEWAPDCVPNCPETESCRSHNAMQWFQLLEKTIHEFKDFGKMPNCLKIAFEWSEEYFKDCQQNQSLKKLLPDVVLGHKH